MNTSITPFSFDGFAIRALTIDGEPWFVAADVCEVLTVATEQTRRLDDDEKGLRTVQTHGGPQQMLVINESGLYSLILTSRKPEAKRFKKWVTSEVLPSIRRTGSYSTNAPAVPQSLSAALRLAADQADQIEALAIERDHAIATKAQIGSKREATAMATAATAKREASKLKDQLGFSTRHATILQVEDAVGGDFGFLDLRRWCKANEVTPETVPDKRYPKGVKAWPAGAWMAVYGVDLSELFGEVAA